MTLRQQQDLLDYLGYPCRNDGVEGPETRGALEDYRRRHGDKPLLQAVAEAPEDFWGGIRYFKREEYRCPCGECGGFPREPEEGLVRLLDRVREKLGTPVYISSGLRCPEHNARVGGVTNSRHLTGRAVDFRALGKNAEEVLAVVGQQPETRYCYAIDGQFVHMDVE